MYTKRDYYLSGVIGAIAGVVILFPASEFGFRVNVFWGIISILLFSLLSVSGFFLCSFLGKRRQIFFDFGKFSVTGLLNTLIDIAVLNGLFLLSGVATGISYALFKAIAYIIATSNSYGWNKFWTFKSMTPLSFKEYGSFFVFSLVGAGINIGVASVIVNAIPHPSGMSPEAWGTIAALVAVLFSKFWNFGTYRSVVFARGK